MMLFRVTAMDGKVSSAGAAMLFAHCKVFDNLDGSITRNGAAAVVKRRRILTCEFRFFAVKLYHNFS